MIDPFFGVIMIRVIRSLLVVLFVVILLVTVAFISTLKNVRPVSTHSFCVNACGDGMCQSIVCLGAGCLCAENVATCPQDCRR